jgi:outer membrane protein assembly factor BamB
LALVFVTCGLAADWPQLLGPTRNGVSTEKGLFNPWPKKGPTELWRKKVGEGYSSPVVADGKLILFHRVGDEDVVECLDAAKGDSKWTFKYATNYQDDYNKGNGPRATPVISGDRVYTLGAAGRLHCLSMKDGKRIWDKDLAAIYEPKKGFFGVGTSPLIEGGLLLINVGGKGAGVVALNKQTGKEVWKATEDEASYSTPTVATIDGVRHVLFFTRNGLLSLDPANGKVRFSKKWRARIDASVNAATPLVLGGDRVFVTTSYDTGALLVRAKKNEANEVWKSKKVLSSHFATPVPVGKYLFGFEGRQEDGASLRCIEWQSGKVLWTEPGFGCGSIIATPDGLIVMSEEGDLVLAEANGEKYKEKARASVLEKPVRAQLALANSLLYAHDGKNLVCWKLKK